ncbi:MAG TPA: hypothetical protein VMV19_15525 [Xanthobacteraceae bacterium]|nr:hypothetical protein [Xanthobacteraceae bacterium]
METRVLNALRHHLMDPAVFKDFCDEFAREIGRRRMDGRATLAAARAEIKRIDRELDRLLQFIRGSDDFEASRRVNKQMKVLEARQDELQRLLGEAVEPPPLLHPEMATFYREQVGRLYEALQGDTETIRLQASAVLRSLIESIVLTPEDGELKIDVRGDLAGILTIALKRKPTSTSSEFSKIEIGRREGRPAGLIEQVKMVAGECNHLELLFRAAA